MTPADIGDLVNNIQSDVLATEQSKRKALFHKRIRELHPEVRSIVEPIVALAIITELNKDDMAANTKKLQFYGFWSGLALLVLGVILLWVTPNPTPPQYWAARVIISLGAAGFSLALAGLLQIKATLPLIGISAAGALGVLVLLYLVNPPPPPATTPVVQKSSAP